MGENNRFEIKDTLYVTCCCICGMKFAIPDAYDNALRKSGQGFNCPNGHKLSYQKGKTLAEWYQAATEAEKELKELKTELAKRTHQIEQMRARLADLEPGTIDESQRADDELQDTEQNSE